MDSGNSAGREALFVAVRASANSRRDCFCGAADECLTWVEPDRLPAGWGCSSIAKVCLLQTLSPTLEKRLLATRRGGGEVESAYVTHVDEMFGGKVHGALTQCPR